MPPELLGYIKKFMKNDLLLVTGITGHTGRYFYETLVQRNCSRKIRVLVRKTSDCSFLANSPLDIELVYGDLEDDRFLTSAMSGVSEVLHITNIRYSLGIVNTALKHNVGSVVCVHTTGIYSRFRVASEEYLTIEDRLQKTIQAHPNLTVTIIRPTMIFGDLCDRNVSKFIRMIDRFRVFPVIDGGEGLLQPVNARDLGRAYFDVLLLPKEHRKSEYILSGDRPLTMKELFQSISGYLGKNTLFVSVPSRLAVSLAKIVYFSTSGKKDFVEKVQRMTEDRSFSHDQAKGDFSYRPEAFQKGLMREVYAYMQKVRK